jgi:hypothetical protein
MVDSRKIHLVFAMVVLGLNCQSHADLNCANTLSIEWKVASADAIYLARLIADDSAPTSSRFVPIQELTGSRPLDQFPHEPNTSRCMREILGSKQVAETEWLLFVRGSGRDSRVFSLVNLTNPLAHWNCAAISCKTYGNEAVFTDRESILDTVQTLIRTRQPLSPYCDPDFAEEAHEYGRVGPRMAWLGIKMVRVNISLWDGAPMSGMDQDTWIELILVPENVSTFAKAEETTFQNVTEAMPFPEVYRLWTTHVRPVGKDAEPFVGTWTGPVDGGQITVQFFPTGKLYYVVQFHLPKHQPTKHDCEFGAGFWYLAKGALKIGCLDNTVFLEPNKLASSDPILYWGYGSQWDSLNEARIQPFADKPANESELPNDRIVTKNGSIWTRIDKQLRVIDYPIYHPLFVLNDSKER